MQFYTSMSNCICGANNLYKWCEYCHLAEPILFPLRLYCKHRLNKYKSRHNFKMKTPKKSSSKSLKKSAFCHVLPFKYQRENKVFQNKESQFIANKFKTSASCILSHILATNNLPAVTTWQSVSGLLLHPVSIHVGLPGDWQRANVLECHLNDSFHTFWPSDVYQLYLTLEQY